MISFFPVFYEDELVYSLLARYHAKNGNERFIYTAEDLYQQKTVHPSIEFVNPYTEEALKCICMDSPIEQVITDHTMFKAYVRFLPKERRRIAYEAMCKCTGNFRNLLAVPMNGERKLKYCPMCASEDRKVFGETYWHCKHQIQRIEICPKHKCYLEDTEVKIISRTAPGLFDAESTVPYGVKPRPCLDKRVIDLARYMDEVFDQPVNFESEMPIGLYLHENIPPKYLSASKLLKHMDQFATDYADSYRGLQILSYDQLQKVFNSKRCEFFYITQIALFEGILAYDLTHLPPEFHLNGMASFYSELSEKYSIDRGVVEKIGEEVLLYTKKRKVVISKSGVRKTEWEKLDQELLPSVAKEVDRICNQEGRPQKLSVTLVGRNLKLPQKQLEKLPKCKAFIMDHMETQPEYWAREIEWTVRVFEESEVKAITKTMICKKLNIKNAHIKCAYPFIKEERCRKLIDSLIDINE